MKNQNDKEKDLKLGTETDENNNTDEISQLAAEANESNNIKNVVEPKEPKAETKDERALRAKKNKTKLRALAVSLVIAIILAAIPLNLLANSLGISWDMTPAKYYSLNQTSQNVLSTLNQDITIYFLYELEDVEANKDTLVLAKILRQYAEYEHITLIDFDISERPDLALQANPENNLILTEGDIVVSGNGLTKKVSSANLFETNETTSALTFIGENHITGAIQYCLNGKVPTIYFLEGHDERKYDEDYTGVVELIRANSYAVNTVNLSEADAVPDDCKILIVADPKSDLTDDELDKLEKYLDKGGNINFLMAPNSDAVNYTNFEILFKQFGVGMNYDIIEETGADNFASENPANIKVEFVETMYTTLTEAFIDSEVESYFPNSRSIFLVNTTNNKSIKSDLLLKCLDDATALTVPCGGINKDVEEEYSVPYLAFASEDTSRGDGLSTAKIIVYGSADFIDDMYIESELVQAPMLLFFSGLTWMYDNSVDMLIESKVQRVDSITIKDDSSADTLLVLIGAVPVCVAIVGFVVWTRRRNS